MKIRKFLCVGLAALTVAGIGAGTSNNTVVNARHRRISRHYRHHRRNYENSSNWYVNGGGPFVFSKYIKHNKTFRKGYHDGDSYGTGSIIGTRIHKHYMKSKLYHEGWVMGHVDGGLGGLKRKANKKNYNKAIHAFNQGYAYASHHSYNLIWLHKGNKWGPDEFLV